MDDLNSIYHSTHLMVDSQEDGDAELELATPKQRILAWMINRAIEVALLIPTFLIMAAINLMYPQCNFLRLRSVVRWPVA